MQNIVRRKGKGGRRASRMGVRYPSPPVPDGGAQYAIESLSDTVINTQIHPGHGSSILQTESISRWDPPLSSHQSLRSQLLWLPFQNLDPLMIWMVIIRVFRTSSQPATSSRILIRSGRLRLRLRLGVFSSNDLGPRFGTGLTLNNAGTPSHRSSFHTPRVLHQTVSNITRS